MQLLRTLLLGTAVALIADAAYGADLPANKSAPVEYVRVCDAYGAGFFYIPGTDTCLKVGGYVRLEGQYTPGKAIYSPVSNAAGALTQVAGAQDQSGLEIRGRIDVDGRTQTAWGTVQTVIQLRATNTDGIKNIGSTGAAIAAGGFYGPGGNGASTIKMERAYIRFAGLTVGNADEIFDVMPGYMLFDMPFARFPNGVKELAYTATFGNGFSATLGLESSGDIGYSGSTSQYLYNNSGSAGYDLVGNVRYDSSWGFVQLSGAVGRDTYRDNMAAIPNSVTLANQPSYNALTSPTGQTGFAIGATARINLPMLTQGDQLNLTASYAKGLVGFVGCSQFSSCTDGGDKRFAGGILRVDSNLIPTSATGAPGTPGWISFGQTSTWLVGGIYTHYWTPSLRSNVSGAYQKIIEPTAGQSVGLQLGNADLYMLAGNLIWSPVKDFNIGVEIAYYHVDNSLQNAVAPNVSTAWLNAGQPGLSSSNWAGKLRIERQF